MPVTTEGQVEVDGRITLGPNTPYLITKTRVHDLPEFRTSDRPRPGTHGEDPAPLDLLAKRLCEYQIVVRGAVPGQPSTRQAVRANMDALQAVVGHRAIDTLQALRTWPLGSPEPEVLMGRARRLRWVDEDTIQYGYVEGTFVFEATDPIRYGADELVVGVGLAEPAGGRTYPKTYPRAYGNAGTPNSVDAHNDGNFPVFPSFTLTGPVTNPRIEHMELGLKLEVGIVLGAGDFLVLDAEAATVMLNGTASRYNLLTTDSTWFPLAPGTNTIRYSAGGVEVGSALTVTYRDGRI